jgi:hypothetical protein
VDVTDWKIANDFIKAHPDHDLVKAIAGWAPVKATTDGKVEFQAETVTAIKAFIVSAKAEAAKATKPAVGAPMIKIAHFVPVAGLSKGATAELFSKGLYDVGRLASLISELAWLQDCLVYEALVEQDNSIVPDQLKASIASLCAVLRMLVEEETQELIGDDEMTEIIEAGAGLVPHGHIDALVKFAAGTPNLKKASEILEKIGARHSKADNERIGKMHELSVELGATCGGDAGKSLAAQLTKVTAERDAFKTSFDGLAPKLDEALTRIKKIEATPMPGGPARTNVSSNVSKENDGIDGPGGSQADVENLLATMSQEDMLQMVIKAAQKKGLTINSFGR